MTDVVTRSVPEYIADSFRAIMSTFPAGVAVVTAMKADGKPWGMTCTALCSVTLRPPTLLVCLRQDGPTLEAVLSRSTFSVNLLHSDARPIAELFASAVPDRFSHVRWCRDDDLAGPRLVDDAHAAVHCTVSNADWVGDHVVVFGKVRKVWECADSRRPLLYGLRSYAAWPLSR